MDEKLRTWPLYITDDGQVQCYGVSCPDEPWTAASAGRRTNVAGLLQELEQHIAQDHDQ